MLTRLKVSGFKNLVDVDVRFGPFTCIAGANGVGKSNLFDAITFLSALADRPLIEAALTVRDEEGRAGDVRSLFHRVGSEHRKQMSFLAEMVVPKEAIDDLGQPAKAAITFLQYTLTLAYIEADRLQATEGLEIIKEELVHIKLSNATKHLLFPHKTAWRKSVLSGRRTSEFISTEMEEDRCIIKRHQDGNGGRTLRHAAINLPRTVLSASNAAESPTVLVARREMQSWRLLQLEPSALRRPDPFSAPTKLGVEGAHLPATLYRLAHQHAGNESHNPDVQEAQVYTQVSNRLAELIRDVYAVNVDRDDKRELLTLIVKDRGGTRHPARSLSDGTLRFLALSILEADPTATGVLCLEEPENGLHPERIAAMLDLLESIATDTNEEVDPDNPLRQVIINTHSPAVVLQIPEGSLVVAELKERIENDQRFNVVQFGCLPDTWRTKDDSIRAVPTGKLLSYLNPVPLEAGDGYGGDGAPSRKRVIDRPDARQMVLGFSELEYD